MMSDDLIKCPMCGSDNLDGEPVGDGVEMPNPDDEDRPIIGYAVVRFVCRACGHRWVDDSTNPANSDGDGDQHNDQ